MLRPFRGVASQVQTLPIEGHDSRDPEELVTLATEMGFSARSYRGIAGALVGVRKKARVLVFGSLYLAGEALSLNGSLPD